MLNEYLYLDKPGIESLYVQTVEQLEIEHASILESTIEGKASITATIKNALIKLLGGPDLEGGGELSGSRKRIQEARSTFTIEHKLNNLLTFLKNIREPVLFTSLRKATEHVNETGKKVFVSIEDRFDAPQFISGVSGAVTVNSVGYVLFEKGRLGNYDFSDDYYKNPHVQLAMVANIDKFMRSEGCMTPMGHDARFLGGFRGANIPLGVFGSLCVAADSYQIKPYAIWL